MKITSFNFNEITAKSVCNFSAAIVLVLATAAVMAGCKSNANAITPNTIVGNPYGFKYLDCKPDGEVLSDLVMSNQKALAVKLYETGAVKAKNAPNLVVYGKCPTDFVIGDGESCKVNLDIAVLKDQSRFFRIDYRLKNYLPSIYELLSSSFDIVITERQYTDNSLNYLYYEKAPNANVNEQGIPYAVWKKTKIEKRAKPVYNSSQEGYFRITEHNITQDTVKDASLVYNEKEGFYSVSLTLDTENPYTTENTIDTIRKGALDKNAAYTKLEVSFELWSNGYFKSVKISEKWQGNALSIAKIASTFDYQYHFSYSEEDCRIDDFFNVTSVIDAVY